MVSVVGFKEMYEAWENAGRNEFDNYQESSEGESLHFKQTDWLEQVPKVLTLQMNRLEFKDAEPFKHRHKVAIDKTIYVDRFMYQNNEKS